MALSIPNTTTQNTYVDALTFTADVDLVTGSVTVANNPAIVQAIYGTTGARTFGPEVYVAPTVIPCNAPPNKPLRGIRFRSAIAGSSAQVFGSLYTAQEPSLGAGTPFGATVTASGAVGQAVIVPRAAALPAGPIDTQLLAFSTGVAGIEWLLIFNSATGKWDCLGGPPLIAEVLTLDPALAVGGAYTDLATLGPDLTPPLAGDYVIQCEHSFITTAGPGTTIGFMAYAIAAAAASDNDAAEAVSTVNTATQTGTKATLHTGLASGGLVRSKYKTVGTTGGRFSKRVLRLWPVGNLS